MHQIEPHYNWLKYYDSSQDERSPFFGKEYNFDQYSETVYGYYIDPAWDNFGSETLYLKILYADYNQGYCILEFIGEWNDAINNDIMTLKRNIIELLEREGISKYILIGENILNFHGSDDSYYEEWFSDLEQGWIVGLNFLPFIVDEMHKYNIDYYINMGESLQVERWRTYQPATLCEAIDQLIHRRLN